MDSIVEFLKKNVKATLVIVAFGIALTLGFSVKGCDVDVAPAPIEVLVDASAPVAPVAE